MCRADAAWPGPLYIAQEARRAGARGFVAPYGYIIKASVDVGDGAPVYLADGGKISSSGIRPVGVSIGEKHPDKGPIVLIDPGSCIAPPVATQVGYHRLCEDFAEALDTIERLKALFLPSEPEEVEIVPRNLPESPVEYAELGGSDEKPEKRSRKRKGK